jgi:hypothetical protein
VPARLQLYNAAFHLRFRAPVRSVLILLKQGRKLLGPPDASVESALTSIQDVERLERMGEAILTVKSWDELLSTP